VKRARPRASRPHRRAATRETRVVWPPSQRQSAREAIQELMRARGLAGGFDLQLEREADKACDRLPEDGAGDPGRRDLRGLAAFTIDPQSVLTSSAN